LSTEIISEIILIVAIFVVGAAIVVWAVADGVHSTKLKQRNVSVPNGQETVGHGSEVAPKP
jgi:hypothetical protein